MLVSVSVFAQRKKSSATPDEPQKVDSMFVHLYTDSLKKGTYNYINIDGKLSNGRFIPLDSSEVLFKASDGVFHGNSLWLDPHFSKPKVTITVTLRDDPRQKKTLNIYIKQAPDPELKTEREIMNEPQPGRRRGRHT